MTYTVRYDEKLLKQLKKLDERTKKDLFKYIEERLLNTEDPRQFGKGLTNNKSGLWRYRINQYRLICKIYDNELIILALEFTKREIVYK